MTHPSRRLDEVIHQKARLGILAVLAEADRADFSFLREALGLTDGNLSAHLSVLEEASLVRLNKVFEGKRPRTWVEATAAGRQALRDYLEALQTVIDRVKEKTE